MECKLLIPSWESERHPDIAVYLAPPPGRKDRTMWRTWIPGIVIEVVSEGSRDRDYTEKRDEYWSLGVKEYWIVETKLLPGFKLPCHAIFDAAKEYEDSK